MSYKIDIHDYDVRKKNALKFLKQGNRVKCTVMFRGREVQHDNLGYELLEKLAEELDDTCTKEGRPKREGRNLCLILTPRAEVMKMINTERRASDKAKKQRKNDAFVEKDDDDESGEADGEGVGSTTAQKQPKKLKAEKTLEDLLENEFL